MAQDAATTSTSALAGALGTPLSLDKGPWVLGEVLIFSGSQLAAKPEWRDKVKGRRGMLYTKADITSDSDALREIGAFEMVEATIFEISGSPAPPEFFSIASSTNQVRLVFSVVEKQEVAAATVAAKVSPPAAVSGVVLTPTAYRGAGRFSGPGIGLDINAAYFIGRLYGKNSFENTVRKTSSIDRIGVWLLVAEGKMQIQSESRLRPAVSVGAQGGFSFRDAPQPSINTANSISVPVQQKTTRYLSDAFIVGSKNIYGVRTSVGFMQGNMGSFISGLSEFLSPQGLEFYAGQRGQVTRSESVPFASLLFLPKPDRPLGIEIMKFNGSALNPLLINFKLGYFLKLNFDLAYLKFNGGYDILGTIQFRYNYFPSH